MKTFLKFFDVLEDKIRFSLSKRPILYGLVSGVGIVLFFRGVWLLADEFSFMTGLVTLITSIIILLLSGAFVEHFISDKIITSGIKKEKKLVEKEAAEIYAETSVLREVQKDVQKLDKKISALNDTLKNE
ncbi:MAG: hypothetical protein UV93_C0011G0006 [Candidatus Azambacteria bacterium GW2011_GWC2_43_27]|uniref:Uncharacterized protein n=1 Tax=Candidatus Zambryskibacteria bacterium RIFOXYD2_FULL_43_10 TaxID=1802782 RepID=A0A1G2V8S4_9BACT|nr:MAG: hypothetical protein UV93_C0011G0006 [Candidatus Azambacteria bacterium GW2011_GWC2_43_27]OHB18031.1 MAG: hypothetical protein A2544_02725 [Candidatus Zambryskibacteria bacterium RIFOXYD2_FULL_43_10]